MCEPAERVIVARAPLRVSLAGGGSDLPEYYTRHGCHLLAAALDQGVEVRLAARPGEGVRVDDEWTHTAERTAELPPTLVRAVLTRFGIESGVALTVRSDCPSGTGLGWSGALTVALIGAAAAWVGRPVTPAGAARLAFAVEREDLGSPVGQQDQWAAALGGVLRLTIDRDSAATAVREPDLEAALTGLLDRSFLLFRTPVRRSAARVLARQSGGLGKAAGMRVITSLVDRFEAALVRRDVAELGELLHRHWEAKLRVSSGAGSPEIARWYALARESGGLGGKIIGAGGGGHLLVVGPEERAAAITAALRDAGLRRIPIGLGPAGLTVAADP